MSPAALLDRDYQRRQVKRRYLEARRNGATPQRALALAAQWARGIGAPEEYVAMAQRDVDGEET